VFLRNSKIIAACLFSSLLLTVFFPFQAHSAESQISSQQLNKDLLGKSLKEVEKLLGKPNKIDLAKGGTTEKWHYGSSFVFFSNELVVVWSDKGELESRREASALNAKRKRQVEFKKYGWKNPWTPGKGVSKDEVLDTIIE